MYETAGNLRRLNRVNRISRRRLPRLPRHLRQRVGGSPVLQSRSPLLVSRKETKKSLNLALLLEATRRTPPSSFFRFSFFFPLTSQKEKRRKNSSRKNETFSSLRTIYTRAFADEFLREARPRLIAGQTSGSWIRSLALSSSRHIVVFAFCLSSFKRGYRTSAVYLEVSLSAIDRSCC